MQKINIAEILYIYWKYSQWNSKISFNHIVSILDSSIFEAMDSAKYVKDIQDIRNKGKKKTNVNKYCENIALILVL